MGFVNSIIYVAIPLVPENGADSALMQRMIMKKKCKESFGFAAGIDYEFHRQ